MGSLEGKTALVTGASRGIGRAIAVELAKAGANVALNYRSGEAQAREVAQEIAAFTTNQVTYSNGNGQGKAYSDIALAEAATRTKAALDVAIGNGPSRIMLAQANISTSQEARELISRVVEKWGRLDVLVNNAGITRDRTLRKLSDDEWLEVINTNLNGAYFCTSAAIPVMTEQKYGRIVNISSVVGQAGNVGQANYSAAKAGMIALTKSAALELAKYNITVNAVCPGFTATDMVHKIPSDIQDQIKAKIPLGRFAAPHEIAKAVLFLVADGDYITGQQLNVNGGIYM